MEDDWTRTGPSDRKQVAERDTYAVEYYARKHGISRDAAQKLIDRFGNDRQSLNAAAADLKV
jgi:Protein of unknown function (DUF3606)